MLSRHGAPPKENFEVLADQLRVCKQLSLNAESSKQLADSLDACKDSNDPYLNTLIRIMATRCMLAAEYFCSGTMAEPEFRHYGLATHIYTHWTSPIRRYADIVAHRQLASAIAYEPLHESLRDKPKLERVCQNINQRHRNAQFAGRASVEYYIGQALKNHELDVEAYVMKVFSNGFVVFVPQFGIEGPIHLRDAKSSFKFDEANYALILNEGTDKEETLQLFRKIIVHVETVVEESTGKRKVAFRSQNPKIE